MRKVRVLIIDDSTVIRRILSDVLTSDPAIEIAGTAANGRIGLAKIPQVNPDVITLDVEMPEMNGLETLKELRKTYPRLPVIMFSTKTAKGANETLDALQLGASDYVTKPANVGSVVEAMQSVRNQLVPKIKGFCPWVSVDEPASVAAPKITLPQKKITAPSIVDIVAIGTSTGGPNALGDILPQFPADIPVPIVIVQHMPPFFTKHLAERLTIKSKLTVREACTGDALQPGHVYIAPGDYHMALRRHGAAVTVVLHQGPPENSCRPAVDVLFRSVAEVYGPHALAAVLTGMGYDGLRGSEMIRAAGGVVYAQDEASSVVWGMPGAVSKAGLANQTLPLNQIPAQIMHDVDRGRTFKPATLQSKVQL